MINKSYISAFLVLFFSASLYAQDVCTPTEIITKPNLGANVNGFSDYSQDRVFNNVFKTNRGLSNSTTEPYNGIPPTVDANGWATQDFGVVVMVGMDSTMGGVYKIKFNGQATMNPLASGFTVQNQVYIASTNITTADLVYSTAIQNGEQMMIGFTNTNFGGGIKGVKNIEIWKPGIAVGGDTFSQKFIDHIKRFSTIRYMDWHATNNNTDSLWADRTRLTSITQSTDHGVAWEYIIEMANILKKDVWINIPHKANDEYVTELAKLFKLKLDPSINIYTEYSNEVWNWQFEQATWNLNQAKIEGNANGVINFDNVNDNNTWHYRRIANRGKQISDIFRSVFGNSAMMTRIRPIYAVQIAWFDVGQRGLEFIKNYYGSPSQYFYGIAGAPYFNTALADQTTTATRQDIFNALNSDINNTFSGLSNTLEQYKASATYYNLHLVCYEGGPDTFGPNNIQAKLDASRDPQMKQLCMDYLNKWYAYGAGELFNWFTAGSGDWTSQYGTWSLTEHFENSHKLQAIDAILAQTPSAITAGQTVPGNIDARKVAGYGMGWDTDAYYSPNYQDFQEYLINVSQAGTYQLIIQTAADHTGEQMPIGLNDTAVTTLNVPNSNSNTTFISNAPITLNLRAGLNTLRFGFKNKNFRIKSDMNFKLVQACTATQPCSPSCATVTAIKIDVKN